jgi:hypothetical protein
MFRNHPTYFLYISLSMIVGLFFVTTSFLPFAYGEQSLPDARVQDSAETTDRPPTNAPAEFFDHAVFRENEQSTVLVNPQFSDRSTNIAFYIRCPTVACPDIGTTDSPIYIFSAENIGDGVKPFSEYWAPPALTDYSAIEYKNDAQQFTCSDKTLDTCKQDPHFVGSFDFTLVSNSTLISPEMLAAKSLPNETLAIPDRSIADARDALIKLSISLSAASITSHLEDGDIVTATLDGTSSVITISATSSDPNENTSLGEFIREIVENVIEVFIPDKPVHIDPVEAAPAEESVTEDNQPPENALQSALSTETIPNESITSEF